MQAAKGLAQQALLVQEFRVIRHHNAAAGQVHAQPEDPWHLAQIRLQLRAQRWVSDQRLASQTKPSRNSMLDFHERSDHVLQYLFEYVVQATEMKFVF